MLSCEADFSAGVYCKYNHIGAFLDGPVFSSFSGWKRNFVVLYFKATSTRNGLDLLYLFPFSDHDEHLLLVAKEV